MWSFRCACIAVRIRMRACVRVACMRAACVRACLRMCVFLSPYLSVFEHRSLARLRKCAWSSEPSLLDNAITTIFKHGKVLCDPFWKTVVLLLWSTKRRHGLTIQWQKCFLIQTPNNWRSRSFGNRRVRRQQTDWWEILENTTCLMGWEILCFHLKCLNPRYSVFT